MARKKSYPTRTVWSVQKHVNEPPKRKNKEVEEIKEIVARIKSLKE